MVLFYSNMTNIVQLGGREHMIHVKVIFFKYRSIVVIH